MFVYTRSAWNSMITHIRKNKGEDVYYDTLCYLLFILFMTIPADIVILPLEIIVYIVVKTDKRNNKIKKK